MIKIDLYDPKTGKNNHYEQARVSFGNFKKVLAVDTLTAENTAKRKILAKKLEKDELTDKEAQDYIRLASTTEEELEKMEEVIVSLFDSPKVNKKALEEGLGSDAISVMQKILTDAMGGIKADSNHPAKK